MTERKCGDCQLCCKLLPMRENEPQAPATIEAMISVGLATRESFVGMLPPFYKPANQRCQHQRHGKGCMVYPNRPFACRYWNCRWLVNDDCADLSRPDRCGYVIDIVPDFITITTTDGSAPPRNVEVLQVWVDPKRPDAHRDPKLRAYLNRRGKEGKIALIRYSESEAFTLWPPSLTPDSQWHEIVGSMLPTTRTAEERFAGIATAMAR